LSSPDIENVEFFEVEFYLEEIAYICSLIGWAVFLISITKSGIFLPSVILDSTSNDYCSTSSGSKA